MAARRLAIDLPRLAASLLAATAGCTSLPQAHEPATAELPARFEAWTLFDVGGQLVYAVDDEDAEDAAALAAAAGDDFRSRTGREPSARLLLVADHDVWLPGGDPCRRLELVREGEAALHGQHAATGLDAPAPSSCEELLAESAKMGVEPRDMLCLIAHPVPIARLVDDFGFPAAARASRDWAVVLPAQDAVDDGLERVMSAALAKELSFAQRLLAAPLMPFVRGVAVDALLAQQKVLIFELDAAAQPDWSAEQRTRLAEDYGKALESDVEDAASLPPATPASDAAPAAAAD